MAGVIPAAPQQLRVADVPPTPPALASQALPLLTLHARQAVGDQACKGVRRKADGLDGVDARG